MRDRAHLLTGRILHKATVNEDQTQLILRLDKDEEAVFSVHGDCCSSSWIEHIHVPTLPTVIYEITDSAAVDAFEEDFSHIQVYSTRIRTAKGELIVEFRNASNGYYGGWMSDPSLRPAKDPLPTTNTLRSNW